MQKHIKPQRNAYFTSRHLNELVTVQYCKKSLPLIFELILPLILFLQLQTAINLLHIPQNECKNEVILPAV